MHLTTSSTTKICYTSKTVTVVTGYKILVQCYKKHWTRVCKWEVFSYIRVLGHKLSWHRLQWPCSWPPLLRYREIPGSCRCEKQCWKQDNNSQYLTEAQDVQNKLKHSTRIEKIKSTDETVSAVIFHYRCHFFFQDILTPTKRKLEESQSPVPLMRSKKIHTDFPVNDCPRKTSLWPLTLAKTKSSRRKTDQPPSQEKLCCQSAERGCSPDETGRRCRRCEAAARLPKRQQNKGVANNPVESLLLLRACMWQHGLV